MNVIPLMGGLFNQGTLPSATPVVITARLCPNPATFTLKSADAGRKIEFSTDGGIEYFTPVYDITSATMIITTAHAPISHVRFTGAAAGTDTWSIL